MADKKVAEKDNGDDAESLADRIAAVHDDLPKGTPPAVKDHLNAAHRALTGNDVPR